MVPSDTSISSANMVPFTVAVLLASLWFAFFSCLRHRRRFSPPLPPGPWGIPILGNLPFLHSELHTYLAALATRHGPIFSLRLGSKIGVVISSVAAAREVLRDHDAVFANRDMPAAASVISYGGSDVVWSPNGPTWRMLRKISVRDLLSDSALNSYYHLCRREMRTMVARVAEKASKGVAVNIGSETFATAMNIMTGMLWGSGTGAEESTRIIEEEFKDVVRSVATLIGEPN